MKLYFAVILLLCLTFAISKNHVRNKRTLSRLLGYNSCRSGECPPWKCQDDSAVIHGYCCGCPGSEYDNVPVPCKGVDCPPDPEPLCSDYDFMMECCCTGP